MQSEFSFSFALRRGRSIRPRLLRCVQVACILVAFVTEPFCGTSAIGNENPSLANRLCKAAANGDVAEISRLVDGADARLLAQTDDDGWLPLHRAAEKNEVKAIRVLLDFGAEIDGTGRNELSALTIAARTNAMQSVEVLLERGATLNFQFCHRMSGQCFYGITPLAAAAREGHLEMVKLLINRGAKISPRGHGGHALRWACANPAPKAYWTTIESVGNRRVIELLIENGARLDQADEHGNTPLITSVKCGAVETVRYLLEDRSDVDVDLRPKPWGATALLWTSHRIHYMAPIPKDEQEPRRLEMIKLLLNAGADPNLRSFENRSPLDLADTPEVRKLFETAISQRQCRNSNVGPSSKDTTTQSDSKPTSSVIVPLPATLSERLVEPSWIYQFPVDRAYQTTGLAVDSGGHVYVSDFSRDLDEERDQHQCFCNVRKLDPNGRVAWKDEIPIGHAEPDGGVCLEGNSHCYVLGSKSKSDAAGKMIDGQRESFIARYSENGTRTTFKTFGGQGIELIAGAVVRDKGGILVAGADSKKPGESIIFWTVLDGDGQVLKKTAWREDSHSVVRAVRRIGGEIAVLCGTRGQGRSWLDAIVWLDDVGGVIREQKLSEAFPSEDGPYQVISADRTGNGRWLFSLASTNVQKSVMTSLNADLESEWAYSWSNHASLGIAELSDGSIVTSAPYPFPVHKTHAARCINPSGQGRVLWDGVIPKLDAEFAITKLVIGPNRSVHVAGHWHDAKISLARSFVAKFEPPVFVSP